MKKKLSFLIPSLEGGGAERVVSIFLHHLHDKYNITLVLMNDIKVYSIPSNINVRYLEKIEKKENNIVKILKLPFLGWKYSQICKEQNIDVSISFMYRPNFISVIAKFFKVNCRFFISERSTPSQTYKGNSVSALIGRLLVKTLYKHADIIIPNSMGSMIDLIHNFSVDKNKVFAIENPFDFSKIEKLSNEPISYNYEGKKIFLIVGRLEAVKEHSLVIESFSALKQKNIELWIMGDGPLKKRLKEQVDQLKSVNKIKFIGFDTNPYKYMKKAYCLVLASSREGFPNVLIESMACKLPIISTDCYNGPKEILSPENNVIYKLQDEIEVAKYGILVPVNNKTKLTEAMNLILEDHDIYTKYKKKIKTRIYEFDKDKIIKKFEELL